MNPMGISKKQPLPTLVRLTPPMTSETTPAPFKVWTNSEYDRTYALYNAFRQVNTGGDYSSAASFNASTGYGSVDIIIDLDQPRQLGKYVLRTRRNTASALYWPIDWNVSGSTDRLNWISIDSQVNQQSGITPGITIPTAYLYRPYEYELALLTPAYQYYKFNFTRVDYDQYMMLGELETWGI